MDAELKTFKFEQDFKGIDELYRFLIVLVIFILSVQSGIKRGIEVQKQWQSL